MKQANSPVYRVQGGHLELALAKKKKKQNTISKDEPKANQTHIQQSLKRVSPESTSSLKSSLLDPANALPSHS